MSIRRISSIGELCDIANGGAWNQTEYVDYGIPVVQVTNLRVDGIDTNNLKHLPEASLDKYEQHTLKANDLIIATVGSHATQASAAGRAVVAPVSVEGMLLNQNAAIIRSSSPDLDQSYLGLLGKSPAFQSYLRLSGKGAANQVRIALSAIKAYKFALPDISVQKRIASVVTRYGDHIANNSRRISLLEEAARLLYREWFVFLRFPGHEHVNIVEGVPHNWTRTSIGEATPFRYGKALKAEDRRDGDFDVFGSSGVVGTHDEKLVDGPAIVVGRKGNVGSVYLSRNGCWPIDTVYYTTPASHVYFFYYALLHTHFLSTDVAVPGLNRSYAHSRRVLIPAEDLMADFDDRARLIHRQIEVLRRQSAQLVAARNLILPRLMDGRIEI